MLQIGARFREQSEHGPEGQQWKATQQVFIDVYQEFESYEKLHHGLVKLGNKLVTQERRMMTPQSSLGPVARSRSRSRARAQPDCWRGCADGLAASSRVLHQKCEPATSAPDSRFKRKVKDKLLWKGAFKRKCSYEYYEKPRWEASRDQSQEQPELQEWEFHRARWTSRRNQTC